MEEDNIGVFSLRRLTCDKGDVEEEEEDQENVLRERVTAGLTIVDQAVAAFSVAETALFERETVITDSPRDGLSGEVAIEAATDWNNDSFITCNSSTAEGTPRVLEEDTKADANQVTFIFEANTTISEDVKTRLKTIDPNFTSISQVNLQGKTEQTSLFPTEGSSNTPEGEQETLDIIEENRSSQSLAGKLEGLSSLKQSECLDSIFLTTVLPSYGSQDVLAGVESQNLMTKNILQASPKANDQLETPHSPPQSFETQYSEHLTHTRGLIANVNLSPLEKGQQVDGMVFYQVPDLLEEGSARLENEIETMEGVFEVKAVETGKAPSAITLPSWTIPELIKNYSFAQPELVTEREIGLINQQEPVFLQEVQDDHSTSVDLENYASEPALTAQQEMQEAKAAALIEECNKKEHDRSLHERISSILSDLNHFQEKLSCSTEPTCVSSEKLTKEGAKIGETVKSENLSQNEERVVSPSSLTSIALLMDAANSNCSSCFGDASEEACNESKETEKALELTTDSFKKNTCEVANLVNSPEFADWKRFLLNIHRAMHAPHVVTLHSEFDTICCRLLRLRWKCSKELSSATSKGPSSSTIATRFVPVFVRSLIEGIENNFECALIHPLVEGFCSSAGEFRKPCAKCTNSCGKAGFAEDDPSVSTGLSKPVELHADSTSKSTSKTKQKDKDSSVFSHQTLIFDGIDAMDKEDYEGAAKTFNRVLSRMPNDILVTFFLGTVYNRWGKSEEALEMNTKLLSLDSQNVFCHMDPVADVATRKRKKVGRLSVQVGDRAGSKEKSSRTKSEEKIDETEFLRPETVLRSDLSNSVSNEVQFKVEQGRTLVVNTGAATGAITKKTNSLADELKMLCGIALESLHSQMPATAIDKYERVIHILQAVSSEVRKDFKVDMSCVRYGLASSLRMSGTYNHFVRALQIYQEELARQTDFPKLTLIWAVAMVYYALFRFEKAKECLKAVEWSNCETCEEQDKSVRCWPGSEEAIPETEVNILKYMVSELEDHCTSAPLPDAVCALSNCLALQQHVIPSKFIYKSDPDYRGCVEVFCEAKCHFHYHPICWKNFKESRSDKPTDKSFLAKVCWTPDCFASVVKICIIDSQGVEKTRLVAEAEVQAEQAVKPKKSKLAKKAEQRESAKDSAKEKRKEKNAKKEHTTEHVSQSKDIEEEATRTTVPHANDQVEPFVAAVKKKKKSKVSQLPKLATSKIPNHPFSYSASRNASSSSSSATTAGNVSALSNWEEIGKIDHAPFGSSSSRGSFPPNYRADKHEFVEVVNQEVKRTESVDHTQEGLYSFILDFLNDNGPVCVDSEDLWNFIALLPEEAQNFLRGPEELKSFLLVNRDFVIVENVIAAACDFQKAFQLALSISDRNQNVREADMGAMSVDLRASNHGIKASQVPPLGDTSVAQASSNAVLRESGLLDEEEDDTYHNTDSDNESELERLRGNSRADTESLASNVSEFQESKKKPEAVTPLYSHFREELATSKAVETDVTGQGGQVDTYQNPSLVEIAFNETTTVENTEFESPRSVSSSPETTTNATETLNPTAPVYAPVNSTASSTQKPELAASVYAPTNSTATSLKNQKLPDETDKVENVQPVVKHTTNFYDMLQTEPAEAILPKSKIESLPVGNETSGMHFQPNQPYPLNNASVSTTANFPHGRQYHIPPPSMGIVHRHPPPLELGYPIMPNNLTMSVVANAYLLEIRTLKEKNQLLYTHASELQAREIAKDMNQSNMAHEKRENDLLDQIESLSIALDKANEEKKACEIELGTISKESEEQYKSTLALQAELDKVNKAKKDCEIELAKISKESEERYKSTLVLQVELDKCKERLYFSEIAKAQMMGALQQSVVMGMAGQNMAAHARMVQLNCPVSVPQPQPEEKISSRPNLNVPTTAPSTLSSKQSQTPVSSVDQPAATQSSLPQGFATMLTLLGRRFPEQKKDDLRIALQSVLAANGNKFRNLTRGIIFTRVEALLIKPQPKKATSDECIICFHALTPCATKLSCGHYFHANCIGEWFQTNTSCPLCRRLEVPESDFPPLC